MAVRAATPTRRASRASIAERFRVFITQKKVADGLVKEIGPIKAELMKYIEKYGTEDLSGNWWVTFPEPVGGYAAIKREKRTSSGVDSAVADRILREQGLWDKCHRKVPVLDEDAIFVALAKGELTDEQVQEMFPQKIVWAFVPSVEAPE